MLEDKELTRILDNLEQPSDEPCGGTQKEDKGLTRILDEKEREINDAVSTD